MSPVGELPWPEGEDPDEDELVDDLLWSVKEDRPSREVLLARMEPPDPDDIGREFERNERFVSNWLCHVRVLHRDEFHEPATIVDIWAPPQVIPLEVLVTADGDNPIWWLPKSNHDVRPTRLNEYLFVHPPREEVRIQMEILDAEVPVIGRRQYCHADDGELLFVRHSWLTIDHQLIYLRNIPWEQGLEVGPYD